MLIEIIKSIECVEPSIIYWYKEMILDYENKKSLHICYQIIENDFNSFKNSLKDILLNCNFYFNDTQLIFLWLRKNGGIINNNQNLIGFTYLSEPNTSDNIYECMEIKYKNIEEEIQARINFKMNELLTAVENTAKTNWNIAFENYSQKHSHYWEAFEQMKQMLIKEMQMATPYDYMAEQNRRKKRDETIDKIMKRFCKKGERDYHEKERLLISLIEDAQNW